MSFKDYLMKKVIPNYFMIVTLIIIGMAVMGLTFYGNIKISILTLFVPPLFGAIGCLPLLVDYLFSHRKSSRMVLLLYNFAELVLLEICILTAAYFMGMIQSLLSAVITACMVFVIFTVVGAVMYIQDRSFCDSLNDALARYSETTDR